MDHLLPLIQQLHQGYQQLKELTQGIMGQSELTVEDIQSFVEQRDSIITGLKAIHQQVSSNDRQQIKELAHKQSLSPTEQTILELIEENRQLLRFIQNNDQVLSLRFAKLHKEIKEKSKDNNNNRKVISYGQNLFNNNYLDPGTRYNRLR